MFNGRPRTASPGRSIATAGYVPPPRIRLLAHNAPARTIGKANRTTLTGQCRHHGWKLRARDTGLTTGRCDNKKHAKDHPLDKPVPISNAATTFCFVLLSIEAHNGLPFTGRGRADDHSNYGKRSAAAVQCSGLCLIAA
jgi:hypothetical protein